MTKYHIKNNDTNEEYTVTEHDDPKLTPKQEPKQTNEQFQQDVKRLYAKYEKEEQAKTKSK